MGFPGSSDSKEYAGNVEDLGSIPVLGRSPGEGNGNPHQYSCLENWSLLLSILYIVVCVCVCVCVKLLQMCLTLCDPMDCSPLGSSIPGIFLATILEWVTIPSAWGSSQPRDRTHVFCISCTISRFFTTEPPGRPLTILRTGKISFMPWEREQVQALVHSLLMVSPHSSV